MRLLLVEDVVALADAVIRHLTREGHVVDHAATAADARDYWQAADHAAILLDLGLPDGSGIALLREARRRGDRRPVIVATARDQISDRIAGLDAGADDYIVKPYDLAELSARVRAMSRRAEGRSESHVIIGGLGIDTARRRVFNTTGEVPLTAREWAVLEALIGARGRILSRHTLEERLSSFDAEIEGNAIEVYISRLRRKLGSEVIETRRGLGYLVP